MAAGKEKQTECVNLHRFTHDQQNVCCQNCLVLFSMISGNLAVLV